MPPDVQAETREYSQQSVAHRKIEIEIESVIFAQNRRSLKTESLQRYM